MSNKIQTEGEQIKLISDDRRKPVAYLNYGDIVESPDPFESMGPNSLGEKLWPVTIQRLGARTRIGFSYIRPSMADYVPPNITPRRVTDHSWLAK